MTALIWASGRGHTEVVDHLLEAGANPDAADKVRDVRECQGDSRGFTMRGMTGLMKTANRARGKCAQRFDFTIPKDPRITPKTGLDFRRSLGSA